MCCAAQLKAEWATWIRYGGLLDIEAFPRLYGFKFKPPPEVAAIGRDRTIIQIGPEHIDAWLQPQARSAVELNAILDRRPHTHYQHHLAA